MCIVPSLEVVRILKKGSPALVFVSLSFMKIWTYSYYLPPAHEAETPSPVLHSAEHVRSAATTGNAACNAGTCSHMRC